MFVSLIWFTIAPLFGLQLNGQRRSSSPAESYDGYLYDGYDGYQYEPTYYHDYSAYYNQARSLSNSQFLSRAGKALLNRYRLLPHSKWLLLRDYH